MVTLCLVLGGTAAGPASAKQSAGDTISVHGHVFGNEKYIDFFFSDSPIVGFELAGDPSFQFTDISLRDQRGRLPDPCGVTQTPNSVHCDFATPVYGPEVQASFTGQTPTMVTGSALFDDGNTATFTAPITIEYGNPTVTQSYATGMKHRRPQFYFSLSAYEGGSAITGFTVTFPRGLSLSPSTGTLHEDWNDDSYTCTRERRRRIECETKTPFLFVSPHFGPSMLVESKALEALVEKHRVNKLPVTFGATDVLHRVTYQHLTAPIKN
jgi:hypothetical protein